MKESPSYYPTLPESVKERLEMARLRKTYLGYLEKYPGLQTGNELSAKIHNDTFIEEFTRLHDEQQEISDEIDRLKNCCGNKSMLEENSQKILELITECNYITEELREYVKYGSYSTDIVIRDITILYKSAERRAKNLSGN